MAHIDLAAVEEMGSVRVGDVTVGFRRAGNGPPLVLLHGVLSDSRFWAPQIAGLSDEFTVLAWDTPGCGASTDPPETFRIADFTRALVGFLKDLDVESPHVLGLSWGSGLALDLYRMCPELPRSLILTGAYAGWAGSLDGEEVRRRLAVTTEQSEMTPEDFVPSWIPGLLTDSAPPDMADEVAGIMSDFHPTGFRAMVKAFAELDLRPVLPTIQAPTLVLRGAEDLRSTLETAAGIHRAIPDSRFVTLDGVGHLSSLEDPTAFNRAVRDFLHSVDRRQL